jgi:preprotein translocase subunit Sec63
MFMMVAKGYEALTDPVAKSNWEKYGNPDGKQSLAVSIGLPEFLLNVDNRNLVLLTYLIFMVMVVSVGTSHAQGRGVREARSAPGMRIQEPQCDNH